VIVDYHMHLRAPDESIEHSVEAVERFVEAAAERGIDEIGFTEHVYYFEQTRALWSVPYHVERCRYDLDRYVDAVSEAKRRGYPVKLGLEVDYVRGCESETADALEPYPWDFLLGSVHFVNDLAVDQKPGLTGQLPVSEAWRRYFGELSWAVASGLFDVMSHLDLIKIFGAKPDRSLLADLYSQLAMEICDADLAVEVSTAGLRKPVGELYPDRELLQEIEFHELPITLASDAHVPADVGRDLDKAIDHARSAGLDTVTVFESRSRRQEPIG
jgi:histidinol-phosphatase (PHP family)